MAIRTSSPDLGDADWQDSQEFQQAIARFHAIYAMPPHKLEQSKDFHERVLDNCLRYLNCCSDIKKIGGSYEGVKVVKSEENDDFEFDVMFILKIPDQCHLEILEIPEKPGYAMLRVANGCKASQDYYRSTNHKFFAGSLTFESDMFIVDAGKTTAAFFGELQKWMNTAPIPGYKLLLRQHGTAIQMDVTCEHVDEDISGISYSVDIAPTLEIWEGGSVKRYVVKPEKKRTLDSITWRRMFDPKHGQSDQDQYASDILQSSVDKLHKQLSNYCDNCKGVCQGSCFVSEARTCLPLSAEYILKLQEALVLRKSSYRLTLVNLQDVNGSRNKRLVAIHYFFPNELDIMPVPEEPGYVWLKLEEEVFVCSRFADSVKLCYLPGGKYLDIKAANDMLVKELKDVVKHLFRDKDVIVRRIGPTVRIDVYPEKGNVMFYYCLDIVLAAYVNGNFYIGLPDDYDDVPNTRAWRRSYSYEETMKIQRSPESLKMVFRVLKALRNGEPGLASLTSYHFKTLLLNMQNLKLMDWNENIDIIFIRVLKYLKICLNVKKLQTHFIPEINLFEKMTNDCLSHMKSRIDELLRSKRKMFKALKISARETAYDLLKKHRHDSTQLFFESRVVPNESTRPLESILISEIEKKLLGYTYRTLTFKPVYEDITVYRISSNEDELLTDSYAVMFINNNRNNLRACRYNSEVIRLKRCNSSVTSSLLHTVTHNSGLTDTRKTAEYIKSKMKKLINESSLLRDFVSVHLEGSEIVLESSSDFYLSILPGYEVGEEFFIAMPCATDTTAWIPVPFTPVRNKSWKAFKISDCGRMVLSELRDIRNSEDFLARLSERHLRMALFWEMEVQRDWSDDKVAERVNDVLDRLIGSVKQKNLPNYFCPKRNTL